MLFCVLIDGCCAGLLKSVPVKRREPKKREPKKREPKKRGSKLLRCGAKRQVTAFAGTRVVDAC